MDNAFSPRRAQELRGLKGAKIWGEKWKEIGLKLLRVKRGMRSEFPESLGDEN
jgi:hypothetical protein